MMKWSAVLRTLVLVVWMAITVVPVAFVMMTLALFVRGNLLYWWAALFLRGTIHGARIICGIKYRLKGWERIETLHANNQPVILCSKHQSMWEAFAFPVIMPRPMCYVFKQELLNVPFFGWGMGTLDMIHIDRSKPAEASAKIAEQGRHFMDKGLWVIIFPEGTRSKRGGQGVYKVGAARLALATDAPIVPIAVSSAACWPRDGLIKWPGEIVVSVGEPIYPQGHTPETMMQLVESWIESEMRVIDPEAYQGSSTAAAGDDKMQGAGV